MSSAVGRSKHKKGFTIVELIISVGTLAIAGIIMIQLFIGAKDVALRAEELDRSVFLANSMVESIKSERWDEEPISGMYTEYALRSGNTIKKVGYYNDDWDKLDEGNKDIVFTATLTMKGYSEATQEEEALYDLDIEIKRLEPYFKGKVDEPVMHTLSTKVFIHSPLEVMEP
jgi:flagellar basal body-associated protein FliL